MTIRDHTYISCKSCLYLCVCVSMNVCTHAEAGWRNWVLSIAFCLFIWGKLFPWTRDPHFLASLEVRKPQNSLCSDRIERVIDAPAGFMAAEIQTSSAHDCAAGTADAYGLFSSVLRLLDVVSCFQLFDFQVWWILSPTRLKIFSNTRFMCCHEEEL